jgi:polysaccharide export outer membrane protein
MTRTAKRASSAAVLLLATATALSGQNLNPADTTIGPQPADQAATLDSLRSLASSTPRTTFYTLGPGDLLSIHVLEAETSFGDPFRISASGAVHLPMAGQISASSLSVAEFEATLADRLRAYIRAPHVTVNVIEYRSRPVTVIGAVENPGVQILSGNPTLLEVLSQAGGLRPEAGAVVLVRRDVAWGPLPLLNARADPSGAYSTAEIALGEVLAGSGAAANLRLRPQDVVSVPRAEMVYVVGAVRQASGFVLEQRNSLSVLEALSLAGGLAPKAAPRQAVILRPGEEGNGPRLQIAVDLKSILAGEDPDLALGGNDVLYVPHSGAKIAAEKAVNAAITIGTGLLIWRR